ncbi:hypothetical protein [Sphaerisporangium sp. TRM90804]|uniref:hypothetical protein n=1 Tax=Sphaerisporangium sp. TRM90804 TaxID=3031113 RepID=UPI00244C3031|nr:hypothetical protein [Sphaerisporangium sp. TRM90804]MDH2424860.1 hypothetical protein [Sphaerisporangium sp. TRM90804]
MTARRIRVALGGATGLLWAGTIGAAMTDLHLKMYLVVWLATLLVSLWTLVLWFTRGDHGALASRRTQIETARLKAALIEESEGRRMRSHPFTDRINGVA